MWIRLSQIGYKTEFQRVVSVKVWPVQPPPDMSCHIYLICLPDSKDTKLNLWTAFSRPPPPPLSWVILTDQTSPGIPALSRAEAGHVSWSFPHPVHQQRWRDQALHSTCVGWPGYRHGAGDSPRSWGSESGLDSSLELYVKGSHELDGPAHPWHVVTI